MLFLAVIQGEIMNEKLIVKGEIFYNWTFLKLEYCSFEYKYSSIRQLYELKSFSKKHIEEQLLDCIKKHFTYSFFITFISWIMVTKGAMLRFEA